MLDHCQPNASMVAMLAALSPLRVLQNAEITRNMLVAINILLA